MSAAELTAQRIYNSYRFASLPAEVKRNLAILFISASSESSAEDTPDSLANVLTLDEKKARLTHAVEDAHEGRVYNCEDVYASLDKKFPWLCE